MSVIDIFKGPNQQSRTNTYPLEVSKEKLEVLSERGLWSLVGRHT